MLIPCPPRIRGASEPAPAQNYLGGLWNHTWSLAVEEHFYFGLAGLFSLSLYLNPRRPFAIVPRAFAVVAVACLAGRFVVQLDPRPFTFPGFHFYTHLRIDSLLFGVLLSYAHHYWDLSGRTCRLRSGLLLLVGCALLSPAFLFTLETTWQMSVFGVISLYLGSGCLVVAALRHERSDNILLRIGGGLGAASYSVYLWHVPVAKWLTSVLARVPWMNDGPPLLIAYVSGCFALGYFMSRLVETPALRLRDRLFPRRATSLPASSAA